MKKEYLYHGSIVPGIKKIRATSKLHHSEKKVVYLSGSIPYALLYIWDGKHNKREGKYVTAGMKDGVVFYEEQFPEQLKAFYAGVSGYLYLVEKKDEHIAVEGREAMFAAEGDAIVWEEQFIPDIYTELEKYRESGQLQVIPFEQVPKERIEALYSHMGEQLLSQGSVQKPDCEEAQFYQTYFPSIWEAAVSESSSRGK